MKLNLLFILFVFLSFGIKAQDVPSYEITKVMKVDSISKKELYLRAKIWVVKNFVSAKDVIQYDDNEHNRIYIKAVKHYYRQSLFTVDIWGYVHFNLEIEIKDGKIRVSISSLSHEGDGAAAKMDISYGSFSNEKVPFGCSRRAWLKFKQKVIKDFEETITNFDLHLHKPYVSNEW